MKQRTSELTLRPTLPTPFSTSSDTVLLYKMVENWKKKSHSILDRKGDHVESLKQEKCVHVPRGIETSDTVVEEVTQMQAQIGSSS